MSEGDALMVAARVGAILGIGVGIVIKLVFDEIVGTYREWQQTLKHRRQISCMKTDWKPRSTP